MSFILGEYNDFHDTRVKHMKGDPNGSVKTIRLSTRTGLLAMIYCVIWVSTYFAVKGFFTGSPARNVYGLMCAWWAALYISSLLRILFKQSHILRSLAYFSHPLFLQWLQNGFIMICLPGLTLHSGAFLSLE